MRHATMWVASFGILFAVACSSTNTPPGTTGEEATSGGTGTGSGGSTATTGGSSGASTSGTTTGSNLFPDGTPCSSDNACQSGVCGLNGSGNCCTTRCRTDDATCGASACDGTGACTYPAAGGPCNGSCTFGQFTQSLCDGQGACSPQAPVTCPNNLNCNAAGTACAGSCDPANGTADCALGWYCTSAGTCSPQIQLGACTSNAQCQSNVCGIAGTGHCCTQTACTNTAVPCGTSDCDPATGACTFGSDTTTCGSGAPSCDGDVQVNPITHCDGQGACLDPFRTDCSPYACESGGCVNTCSSIADCAKDFYCQGGACIPQQALGSCGSDDTCLSGQCAAGSCCYNPCPGTDPACAVTSCDSVTGACNYPSNSTPCGTVLESCAGVTQQNPSLCDGVGNCPAPGTTDCTPFACGATACNKTCTGNSNCAPGDYCDVGAGACCAPLLSGGTLTVDSSLGSDSAGCCGMPGYTPCQTIGFAMKLIDQAKASNVVINVQIDGAGGSGDWTYGAGELIPIVLGWGVEINAPGISFGPNWYDLGASSAYPELFDVKKYSANDTVGYASIVGSFAHPVQIGVSAAGFGTQDVNDTSAIQIESGQHLYLANAQVNGSLNFQTTAITIAAGGSMTLGSDQSGGVLGTVNIGSDGNNSANFGYRGIVCKTDHASKGCTIDDVAQTALTGTNSVVMEGLAFQAIDAEDYASISLIHAPLIGFTPSGTGYQTCPSKEDASAGTEAILLNGKVSMTFTGGAVQCIAGTGFKLTATAQGQPSLTVTSSTIQNTNLGIYASAGTATVAKSSIVYNYNGVQQDTDGTNIATIDLSGGAAGGTNTVACASSTEFSNFVAGNTYTPAVTVLNSTSQVLNASNVAWDTSGPDLFSCTDSSLTNCTCQLAACTNAGGVDDMDAVYDSTGSITTANATQSNLDCTPPAICGSQVCGPGTTCCQATNQCLLPSQQCGGGGCGGCGICGICGCGFCGICGFCGFCGFCG